MVSSFDRLSSVPDVERLKSRREASIFSAPSSLISVAFIVSSGGQENSYVSAFAQRDAPC